MAAGTKARWGQRGLLQLAIPTSEPQTMQNNDGQTSKNSIIHIALPTFLSSCAQLWLSVFVSARPLAPWSTPISLPTAVPGPPLLFPLRCFNSTGCGAHTPLGLDRPPMFFVMLGACTPMGSGLPLLFSEQHLRLVASCLQHHLLQAQLEGTGRGPATATEDWVCEG